MNEILEREILWTGIGGQGVQLAAKILALAATHEGREVMSLGTYGGTMRGGNTDATIVIANGPISSPPMVSKAWSAVIVHPRHFEPIRPKLRAGGVVLVDGDLLEEPLPQTPAKLIKISATKLARDAKAPKAAALILLGAFARTTEIVSLAALEEALAESLPSYRLDTLESNRRAISVGYEAMPSTQAPAWKPEAA